MKHPTITRRSLLAQGIACGLCAITVDAAAANPKLDPKDPMAAQLGYVEDARNVATKKFPSYKPGQTCANCALVHQPYGFFRPCKLFSNKLVSAKGWCSGWVAKESR